MEYTFQIFVFFVHSFFKSNHNEKRKKAEKNQPLQKVYSTTQKKINKLSLFIMKP